MKKIIYYIFIATLQLRGGDCYDQTVLAKTGKEVAKNNVSLCIAKINRFFDTYAAWLDFYMRQPVNRTYFAIDNTMMTAMTAAYNRCINHYVSNEYNGYLSLCESDLVVSEYKESLLLSEVEAAVLKTYYKGVAHLIDPWPPIVDSAPVVTEPEVADMQRESSPRCHRCHRRQCNCFVSYKKMLPRQLRQRRLR